METNILKLPNELLHLILKNLGACDLVAFAQSCTRFSHLCKTLRSLNFENRHSSLGKSYSQLSTFFEEHLNPSLLRSCNFNGCYWIPADTLKSFLIKCPKLQELHVVETELTLRDIGVDILPFCSKVFNLSFSLKSSSDTSSFYAFAETKPQLLRNLKKVLILELVLADTLPFDAILRVLCSFDNLEETVVSRARVSRGLLHLGRQGMKLFPRLKSLIFVALASKAIPFYDVREDCKLTTLWTNVLGINCPELKNCQLKSLSWNSSKNEEEIHPGIRLDDLESYWEPRPILMKSIRAPSKLKLVRCFFDSENFQDFCRFSPLIEVLKLDCISNEEKRASALVWNSESWERLFNLKVLSLRAALIAGKEEQKSSRKRKLDDNCKVSPIPLMISVVQSSPLIQELEIMGPIGIKWMKRAASVVATQELSAIAQLIHLKRLTLSNLNVENGLFLAIILVRCTKLESLRLEEIGRPKSPCCLYVANLCATLQFAKNLTTLCLIQKNVSYETQLKMLLDSLEENCPKLSRLGLVLPSNTPWKIGKEKFKRRFLRLCEKRINLVALYTYLTAPLGHCNETNLALKKRFEEERPAFRAGLTSPYNYYFAFGYADDPDDGKYCSGKFPVMHRDVLTQIESQVAVFPFNAQPFLQRTF